MDLSPEVLREAQFTERFRGYDAGEVDAFLTEAADALEVMFAEAGGAMAEAAAAQARLAIEEVRRESLAEVEELQARRAALTETVDSLVALLHQRRRLAAEEVAAVDAVLEAMHPEATGPQVAISVEADPEDSAADSEADDPFLQRLDEVAANSPE